MSVHQHIHPEGVNIIIVGAGICALMTAIQLERAGMDYVVFEKVKEMLEDIQKVSLPCQKIDYVREDLSKVGTMDAGNNKERYGYNGILITRPAFYDILLSRVPAHKINWGKRILGMEQNQYGVMIRVADNSTHHADILIGAEEEFPVLKDRTGDFHVIIGKERSIQVYLFTFAESRIGWQICGKMECPEDHDEQNFRFSDWVGPVAADDLCDQVRHYQCPFGGTLGDLMDRTPKERLSKVMLEDKYFHTWWHLRTVLMGDACHNHLPFGGQGANQAILDSVHLVNQLYAIPSGSLEDIAKSFKAYHANRSPNARGVFKSTGW
ncbi:hypothetical protein KVV02_003256 [Mortierella alpina]|uniref:FAD-binding domain-containing protein n=1 Tax=Mortierella alpina TaxID=64518 RepID=A0A9P7ZWW9_MORAP|nr:hypothetical protein KVV02_003256 [Mortierella alpina]